MVFKKAPRARWQGHCYSSDSNSFPASAMKNIPLPLQLTFAILAAFSFFNVLQADFSIDRQAVVVEAISKAREETKSQGESALEEEILEIRVLLEEDLKGMGVSHLDEVLENPFLDTALSPRYALIARR